MRCLPLLGSVVGGAVGPEYIQMSYGQKKSGSFSGQRIDTSKRNNVPTFFVIARISNKNKTFHGVSPFLVEKAITGSVGDVKSTKKLRSGDLLVEVESLSTILVTVKPHAPLNSSKGIISCGELLNESEEKITEELKSRSDPCASYYDTERWPTPQYKAPDTNFRLQQIT
ncbi:hypothetical protein AVEN_106363-1 [Araneus ventricosus]|uniref:Uncharacterized protein n=1 Tax=Araneus ventricosus TaxID=182803 RepID=A0A4Y2ASZ1_ARAVE|nr:hypothetical protein AVEN_106363-1 [Araneus ventricosus]